MAIRVGRWDCSTCGHKGNYGPRTSCINCGAPRPADVRFYLPDKEEVVSDDQRLKEAKQGPDWRCGHCSASNKAGNLTCTACGNPRDQGSGDVTYQVRRISSQLTSSETPPKHVQQPRPGRTLLRVLFTILAGIGLCILATVACRRVESYPVAGHRWERTTDLEQYTWVTHEDWDLPSGAELITTFEDIHHYNSVYVRTETRTRDVQEKVGEREYVCGQRDLGNGYFEDEYCTESIYETRTETYEEDIYENVPVYQTKYRYRIQEWVFDHTISASGNDQSPHWPAESHPGQENRWREGVRQEEYWLLIRDHDGETHEEEVPFSYWQQAGPGTEVPVVTYFGIWGGIDKTRAGISR